MSPVNENSQSYWRSFGQLDDSQEYRNFLHREFQEGASELPKDDMTRRSFLKILGASFALAGLAGCDVRRPKRFITPYVKSPESFVPGKTMHYATTMTVGDDVVGLLAESFEGRPIKLEGNVNHPGSLGATKSFHQASVLGLYDPDRLKVGTSLKKTLEDKDINAVFERIRQTFLPTQGQGLAILTETSVSPTFNRLLDASKNVFPYAVIYLYEPVNDHTQRLGLYGVSGQYARPVYGFDQADIIVGFGSDFLGLEMNNIANTRSFSSKRDPDHPEGMSRFYAIESTLSLTGAKADHRVSLKPSEVPYALAFLVRALVDKGVISDGSLVDMLRYIPRLKKPAGLKTSLVDVMVDDLKNHKGRSLIVAGYQQPAWVHGVVYLLNRSLQNQQKTVRYYAQPFSSASYQRQTSTEAMVELVKQIDQSLVQTLVVLGGDPVFNAPSNLSFSKKIGSVPQVVSLSLYQTQTTKKSHVVVPRTHYLESWGDATYIDGTVSIAQPLIAPLYKNALSELDVLTLLLGRQSSDYDEVRQTHGGVSDNQWEQALAKGVLFGPSTPLKLGAVMNAGLNWQVPAPKKGSLELGFYPSYSVYDGRFANNGWLQETPDPITKLTWDNALYVSQETAKRLQLELSQLAIVRVRGKKMNVPVFIQPGLPEDFMALAIGYGSHVVGRVGQGTGFNAYLLKGALDFVGDVKIEPAGGSYRLATTQEHGSMEGRPIYRYATLEDYQRNPLFAKEQVEHLPLVSSWDEKKYTQGYQWGMVIDLNKCTGCSACLTACQSENNIPIVGKKQVLLAREMHWIRIDRYYDGSARNPKVLQQPVMCLQCEMAPCEQVCPVAATVHDEEGLNTMAYNRCVGTRYCANNCPVKVRRFNFLDFHQRNPQSVDKDRVHLFDYFKEPDKTVQKQFNPDVTVRMRGVMEKCTFCVQRINEAKIEAKNHDKLLQDGAVVTACQQVCPAEAILFGNILDPNSQVAKAKTKKRDYEILSELNLKARVSYTAGVVNSHLVLEESNHNFAKMTESRHSS